VRSYFSAFAAVAVNLVILENPVALGVTANFEQALGSTTGDLLFLSDQDDIWHPTRVSRCAALFETRPELDLVFTDAHLIDGSGSSLSTTLFDALEISPSDRQEIHAGKSFDLLLRRNLATGATMAFRRSLLKSALPLPPAWIHDEWMAILGAALGTVDSIDDPLIDYRQHGANEIGVQPPTLARKLRTVLGDRGNRIDKLVERSGVLATRLGALGDAVPDEYRRAAEGKWEMEKFRLHMPAHRLSRIGPIIRADRKGWYATFCSQGRLDMLRDLLQSRG